MSKNHSGKLSFKIHFVLIVILFYQLSGSQFVLAQSIAEDLLKNIQDKFDSINDLSAEITQLIDSNINLKGKVYYRKENHFLTLLSLSAEARSS